jgi:hypothetical protein
LPPPSRQPRGPLKDALEETITAQITQETEIKTKKRKKKANSQKKKKKKKKTEKKLKSTTSIDKKMMTAYKFK